MPIDEQGFKMIIEERIEDEKKVVELLRDSMRKTKNTVIRLLLHRLALDSIKHGNVLRAILRLSESKRQLKSESEEFREVIYKHIEIERKMLEEVEKIVDKTEDDRIRFLLQDIVSDEKRHHTVMKRVHELVCKGETVKDEKWWDFLFRYSRLTG